MTRTTEVDLNSLQQQIPHLDSVSEDGWVLRWPESEFELVCRKASALQIEQLDKLMSAALPKAAEVLK